MPNWTCLLLRHTNKYLPKNSKHISLNANAIHAFVLIKLYYRKVTQTSVYTKQPNQKIASFPEIVINHFAQ